MSIKTLSYVVGGLIIIIGGFFALNAYIYKEKQGDQKPALSPREATYVIEKKVVQLTNGLSETEVTPDSASKTTTRYFGNEATYDFDKDGRPDTALLLTQETGGSGTFFYLTVALNKETGYEGLPALLLGDRIAPQTTEIRTDGTIIVNYAERKPGEPMTTRPSVGVSKYFVYDSSGLKEIIPPATIGEHCGGNMTTARTCQTGSHCAPLPDSHLPLGDVGGVCVTDTK